MFVQSVQLKVEHMNRIYKPTHQAFYIVKLLAVA